jgi:hypothetical protein
MAMLVTIRGTASQISPTATMMVSGTGSSSRLARPPVRLGDVAEFTEEMFFLNIICAPEKLVRKNLSR